MTKQEKNLNSLMPHDPLMAAAWYGSLRYALGNEEMLAAFREATGNTFTPGKTALDRMIDEATGADYAFIYAFAKWYNKNIWGEEEGKPIDAPK